jgi:predicted ATPase/DNA-binding SARP family transcriptional activator
MPEPLEIRLLGPFEVLAGGAVADVGGSKRQALLAMLALNGGRVVRVDALVEGLWGDDLPAAPRNALHHHVARLRAALGQGSIMGSGDGYALGDASVDALRFEEQLGETRAALREGDVHAANDSVASALELWRGGALQALGDTAWFSAEARRLESLRVDLLEEQFEVALALGEHREVVPALRTTLQENPFRERVWAQLMLALYRSGRQADALETFQEARRVLAEALGLEPGPELRHLQDAILAHDPAISVVPVAPRGRGNLPASTTSFVDREDALAEVLELMRRHRLVTLTGPPGVGKSRLALEAARSFEREIRDGVSLVDLGRAAGAEDVARLIAQAVDVRGSDPFARVTARLRNSEALVLLDACEHVLEEAARLTSALLGECPGVRVLATSRESLHLTAEARFRVDPLPVTDGDSPAVQLFADRAGAARPGFGLTPETAALVAEITRRVEGLPLAIELAAARVNVLGLTELLSAVERRLALRDELPTSDPSRTALRALVEWSYDLLHGDEKTLLQQLAVHRGGASLASLAAVGARHGLDEANVTYLLGTLVDKSIISASFSDEGARYDLLDTVREYVWERLIESGDLAATRKAHAEYFAALAGTARDEVRGPQWLRSVHRLEVEHDNFWAALAYASETPEPLLAMRLAAPLGWYFALAERVSEGRRFLELAGDSAHDMPLELQLELLGNLCYLATEEGDLDAAIDAGERGLAFPGADSLPQLALVQLTLALARAHAGDEEQATKLVEAARNGFERAGDDWGVAASTLVRAQSAARVGDVATVAAMAAEVSNRSDAIDYDAFRVPAALLEAWAAEQRGVGETAAAAYRRALELAERARFTDHAAFALSGLGSLALAGGDLPAAEELQRQALATAETAGATWAMAHARIGLARVFAAGGDSDGAEALYREVSAWSELQRPHRARESLFLLLAGDPATAAVGARGFADARSDAALR